MTRLPVLLVDDDDLMRAGIRSILSSDDRVAVVGEAADGRQAIAMAQRFGPRVVLMDVRMPDMGGIAATREIVRLVADARVLMLTTFSDDDYVLGGAPGRRVRAPAQAVPAGGADCRHPHRRRR